MGESDGGGGAFRGRVEHSLPPNGGGGGGGGRRRRRPRSPEEEAPPAAVQAVAAAAAGVEGAVRMAGYLEKRGRRRLVATWRRHWFVLQGRLLLRYRSRRDYLSLASCRGALNLGLASAVRPGPTAAGGAIEVVTRSQVVTLRARDKVLRERWLAALLDAARGSTCTANTPPGVAGLLGANGGPLGAGPHHFRYSLDHLPTALHRHDAASPAAAAGGGGGGGAAVPGGGMGAANARRSLSLEAVVPCAAARPKNVHPVYAHAHAQQQPWAHAGGGYGDSVLGVRGRYDDEDAIFFYSSCDRNLSRVGGGSVGAVSGSRGGSKANAAAEDAEELQPRSASASTAGSSTATASTAASAASTKPKRKGLKLRLRRRNTSEAENGCDGICSEPKRRPSFLERVLTSVRGGNGGGGGSRSVSPLPPIRASATPPPPTHLSDPEYDSVPTTTLTGDGEDDRHTPTPQRDAMLAEDEDESSSCASSFEDDEDTLEDSTPAVESEGGDGGGGGGRVGAAGLVGSASLLPKPALVELRQRLRRRAESNRDSGDFACDVTGLNGYAAPTSQRVSATSQQQDEDGAVFEGYEGFAELRRRWRERASDLAAANANAATPIAAHAPQQGPQPEVPPPLPRKQRAAIAAALAAAQEEAAAAAAAAVRASHGGKVREMATHFEAVASSGAARRRSDELGALLAQLAELTAAPLAPGPGPGAQRPPVPGAATATAAADAPPAVEYRVRCRKDSDPDYDIPRPHGAALGLASRAPVAATAIDASPFLGGGVHRPFAQLNVATTHGGDDSTDDGELSWTGLSMAPDSLEPLPVRLLDATG